MLIAFFIIIVLIIGVYIFLKIPAFGKMPEGNRLENIKLSPNYRNGSFQNISPTPDLTDEAGYFTVLKEFLFKKNMQGKPAQILPSKKTNLLSLPPNENILVWFGHSSYFMQIDGNTILVDPVLSGNASPVKFTTKSFEGSDVYTPDDFPVIDYLFITHDHWDHMDHETLVKLKPKINKVITGLGTGAHLEHWGYDKNLIVEKDWNEELILGNGFVVNTTPGRHFSGRGLKRNQTLWMSYVLATPTMKIFIGGDSGYDTHFKTIGETYGPFDLAIIECGQYHRYWKYIHMMPEDAVQAAMDLQTKKLIPVHWGKFTLALHAWNEPVIRFTEAALNKNMEIITPMIGEKVDLNNTAPSLNWWKNID